MSMQELPVPEHPQVVYGGEDQGQQDPPVNAKLQEQPNQPVPEYDAGPDPGPQVDYFAQKDPTIPLAPVPPVQQEAKFEIGLTPLGRPAVNITDTDGVQSGYVFNGPEELAGAVGHLQALLTMLIENLYKQRFAEQQAAQQLIQKPGEKLWTPQG